MEEFNYHRADSRIKNDISLSSFLTSGEIDMERLRSLFINMDSAMKYIHNKGYFIDSFDPDDIHILNNSLAQIRFDELSAMPNDFVTKKAIVKENIKISSFLQIGIYANCLQYLNPSFLKSNFDDFAQFLPEGDVPYYRGIIERDASVYFSEYALEKRRRDLEALENELGGQEAGRALVKSTPAGALYQPGDTMNTKVNDNIYKQLANMSDAAFVSFLVIPCVLIIISIVMVVVTLLAK